MIRSRATFPDARGSRSGAVCSPPREEARRFLCDHSPRVMGESGHLSPGHGPTLPELARSHGNSGSLKDPIPLGGYSCWPDEGLNRQSVDKARPRQRASYLALLGPLLKAL